MTKSNRKGEIMLHIKSENGDVEIKSMDGTEKRIIGDLGAAAHKTLLLIANNSKSKEEVFLKYGLLVRELVDYLEETVRRVEEIEG